MKFTGFIAGFAALAIAGQASAAIEYIFTDDVVSPDRSDLFDGESSVTVEDLLDPDTGLLTDMSVTASAGDTLNSNSGDFGITSETGSSGAVADGIDDDEVLTISFSSDVELDFVDLGGVGSNTTDGALLTIGTTEYTLHTGSPSASEFDGTLDTFTPATPIFIAANTPLTLEITSGGEIFDLEVLGFTVIPEPASAVLLALGGTLLAFRPRRKA